MGDLTRERREEMRADIADLSDDAEFYLRGSVVLAGEIRALLDAADERDRLREEARRMVYCYTGGGNLRVENCTFEYRPLTDEERAEIGRENR